jgi:hypothetical protein
MGIEVHPARWEKVKTVIESRLKQANSWGTIEESLLAVDSCLGVHSAVFSWMCDSAGGSGPGSLPVSEQLQMLVSKTSDREGSEGEKVCVYT